MASIVLSMEQLSKLKEAFLKLKAEEDQFLLGSTSDAFVQTGSYVTAQNQGRCLLVGRKGSGKTALMLGHRLKNQPNYLSSEALEISIDQFPLETLLAFFYADFKRSAEHIFQGWKGSDLSSFLTPAKVAAVAWRESIRSASVQTAARQLIKDPSLDQHSAAILNAALNTMAHRIGTADAESQPNPSSSDAFYALIVYYFTSLQNSISEAISTSTATDLPTLLATITAIMARQTSPQFDAVINQAASTLNIELGTRKKRALLTLDRFDDFVDHFYKTCEPNGKERREFFSVLLEGLVLAARELKKDASLEWMDLLLAIPLDKFLELHLRERATIEHLHVLRVEWNPHELLEFVNRRLALALGIPKSEVFSAWDTIFPFSIANGKVSEVKEHSFLYLLRHTLWKPREVQMYLWAIFSEMEKNGGVADEQLFRDVVSRESSEIVRKEFLEEFESEYPGIRALVQHLENRQLRSVMTYEELCNKISGASLHSTLSAVNDVALRLYQMGVIGVRRVVTTARRAVLDSSIMQDREQVVYRFSYNSLVIDPFVSHTSLTKVVIHPMFFEFLNVSHEERYVVNQLSWEMFEPSRETTRN